MVRLSWKEGPAIKGLLKIVFLCWWAVLSVFASFALLPLFGWISVYVFFAANIFLLYMLNQTRKHFEGNVLDDKLSTSRMSDGEERFIEDALRRREDEAQKQKKNK